MSKILFTLIFFSFAASAAINSDNYYKCIKDNVKKYSVTGEPAGDIASASVTSCGSELSKVFEGSPAFNDASPESRAAIFRQMQEQGKELAIKYALDEKLKKR